MRNKKREKLKNAFERIKKEIETNHLHLEVEIETRIRDKTIKEYQWKARELRHEIEKEMSIIFGKNYLSYNVVRHIFYKPIYGYSGNVVNDLLSDYESLLIDINESLAMIDRNDIHVIEKNIDHEMKKEELKEKKINNWKNIIVGIIESNITKRYIALLKRDISLSINNIS